MTPKQKKAIEAHFKSVFGTLVKPHVYPQGLRFDLPFVLASGRRVHVYLLTRMDRPGVQLASPVNHIFEPGSFNIHALIPVLESYGMAIDKQERVFMEKSELPMEDRIRNFVQGILGLVEPHRSHARAWLSFRMRRKPRTPSGAFSCLA
jgi:hypothetical protein